MEKPPRKVPIKVSDKRKHRGSESSPAGGEDLQETDAPAGGGDLHGTHTEQTKDPAASVDPSSAHLLEPASLPQTPPSSALENGATDGGEPPAPNRSESPPASPPPEAAQGGHDYLGDLQRVQAEFENYRKRMMKEQSALASRAAARVVESLLPVLDNFERAIAHGEGGGGVELVFKDFKAALEREGVEEIPAEGVAFDPTVHEAVESRDVPGLEEPTCLEVFRRGYMLKGRVLRPAMVVVGRPSSSDDAETAVAEG